MYISSYPLDVQSNLERSVLSQAFSSGIRAMLRFDFDVLDIVYFISYLLSHLFRYISRS